MKDIIKKYFLKPGSKLVSQQIRANGVDCWFDIDGVRQHRCIEFPDYIRTFTIRRNNETSGIDRNFQEDMIDDMDMGQDI